MTTSIEHLLLRPEEKTLEFKHGLSSPRNVLKTLVAFANAAGRKPVIDPGDARRIIGVPPLESHQDAENEQADFSRLESKLAAKVALQLCTQPAGKAELAKALGHASVSGELHKQIRRLLDQDLIEMAIPDKPQSRLQRYRLTQSGYAMLDQVKPPSQ